MTRASISAQSLSLLLLSFSIAFLVGCAPEPLFTPTPTKTPDLPLIEQGGSENSTPPAAATPLIRQSVTELPPSTPSPIPADPPTASTTQGITPTLDGSLSATAPTALVQAATFPPPPTLEDGLPADHYVFIRPIPDGYTTYLDRTYPYGSTAGRKFRPHTGVEFFNAEGTPVLAVANATVEYAGTDAETLYGPQPNFYGNLIVLRISDQTYYGQPLFAVYGHLSQVFVQSGQQVKVGETIGAVGGTGIANGGAHLHFEVRAGNPLDYFTSTRNPDLWIKPYARYGTLAGRIVDASGTPLPEVSITINTEGWVRYTWTYAGDENKSDQVWGENFTYGDLPEGWYSVTFGVGGKTYREQVYIRAGRTSWLEFVVGGS